MNQSSLRIHGGQLCAALECACSDGLEFVGKKNGGQCGVVGKGICTDFRHIRTAQQRGDGHIGRLPV